MCGFYFSNKQPNNDYNFKDVKQRGLESKVFSCNQYFAIQSILPCITNSIDFSIHETEEYLFLYTGQIYNYDREFFNSDTKMFLHDIRAGNSLSHYNGMYAYVYYDKKLDKLKFSRDKTGQIPLFIYQKNGHIVISNTIKSIVETTDAVPNKKCLDLWQKSKHYIFNESPWTDIYSVKPNGLELDYLHTTINDVFKDMKQDYVSPLKSASINSGGVDSGIVSKWFGEFQVAINHQGKDFVSSNLDFAYNINEKQWCEYVDEFIQETYMFPYTWSWVGYYILGKKLHNKINILYTGEGADEIFGGYPDYSKRKRTPYSLPFDIDDGNFLINNKLSDQQYFIPVAAMGANIALGCFTIEPRSPFLDRRFMNDKQNLYEDNKITLKNYYKELYKQTPYPKQGFGGFPNEYYNHVYNTTIENFESNDFWKSACIKRINELRPRCAV